MGDEGLAVGVAMFATSLDGRSVGLAVGSTIDVVSGEDVVPGASALSVGSLVDSSPPITGVALGRLALGEAEGGTTATVSGEDVVPGAIALSVGSFVGASPSIGDALGPTVTAGVRTGGSAVGPFVTES